jgi:hypothetical protein
MMVGVARNERVDSSSVVTITLLASASLVNEVLYGKSGCTVAGNLLSKTGLAGLEVDILVLNLM